MPTKTRPAKLSGLDPQKRKRRSKAEIEALRTAIYDLCELHQPLTVRQLFYRMVVASFIAKTQREYKNTVCRLCGLMREEGDLPWEWIVDETRWMRKPRSYGSLGEALEEMQFYYQRDFWRDQDIYSEVWCESGSAAGVIDPMTYKWDVPLMPAHGFSSKAFCWNAAKSIEAQSKPAHILYVGDYDPSGVLIDADIEAKLRRYAPQADITFSRIAVTPEQIDEWDLPGSPPKDSKHFKGESAVEVEAIEPGKLRQLVQDEIESLVDFEAYQRVLSIQDAEQKTLESWIDSLDAA